MFSLLSGTLDMNTVYKIGFHSDTGQTMGPRFGCGSPFIAWTIIIEHRRQMELIQMIEYIGFHVASHYETSRVFILGFFPPSYSSNNKANWQSKEKKKEEKKSKQPVSDLFGTSFKVVGSIQNCISECSKQPLSFEIILIWKNKIVKYITSSYVKNLPHV